MRRVVIFVFLLAGLSVACTRQPAEQPLRVGLSKEYTHKNYTVWLHSLDRSVVVVDLWSLDRTTAYDTLESLDALILTGGEDVDPDRYGQADQAPRCEINASRDTFELALLVLADQSGMPTLGVCRGVQIMNVYRGGSLVVDIPEDYSPTADTTVTHRRSGGDAHHGLFISSDYSPVPGLKTEPKQKANSAHHQAVNQPGVGLIPWAWAPDSLVEAVLDTNEAFFFGGVQWHPERLPKNHPYSRPFGLWFLKEADRYRRNSLAEFR